MSNESQSANAILSDDNNVKFMIRWRGRREGPYTAAEIEARLAANQIGLLHEISYDGRWLTLRDYFAERDASLLAQRQAREDQDRRDREEATRQAKEREGQRAMELATEERRKNDLLQAHIANQHPGNPYAQNQPLVRKSHRAGTILALSIIGLFIFGPLCIAAWIMGDNDLREMDAGIMDNSGRSTTTSGRSIGILGTVLWLLFVLIYFFH
jgi:hypothetical protein